MDYSFHRSVVGAALSADSKAESHLGLPCGGLAVAATWLSVVFVVQGIRLNAGLLYLNIALKKLNITI